ncbi:MAG: dihydroneopterin aldolase [Verrucomicrobiales bacterium]
MPDTIHIRGLAVTCHIGAGEEERSEAQELRLDLDLLPENGLQGLEDDLERTIDYHAVSLAVQALAAARPRRLVETLADDILDLLRDDFGIQTARVTVRKFILPFTEWVGVTLQRPR